MQLGKWSLTRRQDGDYSLYEEVSPSAEDAAAVETVERARFSFQVFWLGIAAAGKVLGLVMKLLTHSGSKKKRH